MMSDTTPIAYLMFTVKGCYVQTTKKGNLDRIATVRFTAALDIGHPS
jgi:hypothetical protein